MAVTGVLSATMPAARCEGLDSACVPRPSWAKGNYFTLNTRAPFSHLIYPVPQAAGLGVQLRLQCPCLLARQPLQIVNPIGAPLFCQRGQPLLLRRRSSHDQFAATPVADATLGAVGVQQRLAPDTQAGLERAAWVVDAGVNHLAVARTDAGADGPGTLEHHHLTTRQRQGTGHGQADHAGADDHTVNAVRRFHQLPRSSLDAVL
jgi:hypothetical protein